MSETKQRRGWTKWLLRVVIVLVLLLAVCVVALLTSWPQRILLQRLAGKKLEANIQLGSVSALNRITISDLKATQPGLSSPLLDIEQLSLGYSLWPLNKKFYKDRTLWTDDHRFFTDLTIGKLAYRLDKSQPKPPAAPEEKKSPPKKEAKKAKKLFGVEMPYLPKNFNVGSLQFDGAWPAYGVSVTGVHVQGNVNSDRDYVIDAVEEPLVGSCWLGNPSASHSFNGGTLNIHLQEGNGQTALEPLRILIPGLVDIDVTGRNGKGGADILFTKCVAQDVDLSTAQPGGLPFPFRFKKLDLTGTHIKGDMKGADKLVFDPALVLKATAEDLSLGPKGKEWYEGNLAIQGAKDPATELGLNTEITLNKNQKINLKLSGKLMEFSGEIAAANWSRDDLLALVPKDSRAAVGAIPGLQGISSMKINLSHKALNLDVQGVLKPDFASPQGAPEPMDLGVTLSGPIFAVALGGSVSATARAQIADGAVTVAWQQKMPSLIAKVPAGVVSPPVQAKVTFAQINPARWAKTFHGPDWLRDVDTRVNGSMDLTANMAANEFKLANIDLKGVPFLVVGVSPGEKGLTLAGDLTLKTAPSWSIAGSTLDVRLGDLAAISLRDYAADLTASSIKGDATAELDLELPSNLLLGGKLQGHAKVHVPVRHEQGIASTDFDLSIENFGFAPFSPKPGATLTAKGALKFDTINKRGEGANLQIALGDATALTCNAWTLATLPSLAVTAPFTFKSDLQPLVSAGLLDSAKGSASATGAIKCESGVWNLGAEFNLEAASLVLAHATAAVGGLTFKGSRSWTPATGMSGSGEIAMAQLAAAGAVLREVKGSVVFDGDAVKAGNLAGKLFDGAVTANLEFGALRAGMPLQVKAHLTAVNLETLSRELGLPFLKLTGIADGDVTVLANPQALQDCQIALQSTGPISVNKTVLEQLMASQYVPQFTGKAQLQKAMAEMLGKDDQCPFDSGKLTLALQGGKFVGQITLKSPKLDLTIDLKIDTAVALDAVRVLQGNQLKNIVNVQS